MYCFTYQYSEVNFTSVLDIDAFAGEPQYKESPLGKCRGKGHKLGMVHVTPGTMRQDHPIVVGANRGEQ